MGQPEFVRYRYRRPDRVEEGRNQYDQHKAQSDGQTIGADFRMRVQPIKHVTDRKHDPRQNHNRIERERRTIQILRPRQPTAQKAGQNRPNSPIATIFAGSAATNTPAHQTGDGDDDRRHRAQRARPPDQRIAERRDRCHALRIRRQRTQSRMPGQLLPIKTGRPYLQRPSKRVRLVVVRRVERGVELPHLRMVGHKGTQRFRQPGHTLAGMIRGPIVHIRVGMQEPVEPSTQIGKRVDRHHVAGRHEPILHQTGREPCAIADPPALPRIPQHRDHAEHSE